MASRSSERKRTQSRQRPQRQRPRRGSIARVVILAFFAIFACSAFSSQAQPPDRARTEALARRATERMQALQREADRLATEERTLIGDLRKVEIDRQLKAEQLKQIDQDAGRVQTELETTATRMERLKRSEEAER